MPIRKKRKTLTEVERREVYELWRLGDGVIPIAEAYNVSKATVSNIVRALHGVQKAEWTGAGRIFAKRNPGETPASWVARQPFEIPPNPPELRTPNENVPGELKRLEAFLTAPDSKGCRLFKGVKNRSGYGMFWTGIKNEPAHRAMWRITYGEIPKGLYALHRCNNPPCCEKTHIWVGTQSQNQLQKVADGRDNSPQGAAHYRAKLTDEKVREMRRLREQEGLSFNKLAARFGVSTAAVSTIISGYRWKHIK